MVGGALEGRGRGEWEREDIIIKRGGSAPQNFELRLGLFESSLGVLFITYVTVERIKTSGLPSFSSSCFGLSAFQKKRKNMSKERDQTEKEVRGFKRVLEGFQKNERGFIMEILEQKWEKLLHR